MKLDVIGLTIILTGCFAGNIDGIGSKTLPSGSNKVTVSIDKINSGNEIFRAPTSSSDCGYYLVSTGQSQRASSFVYNGKVYFSVPCKTSDSGVGGWHYGMMYWGIGNLSTTWIDGDIGTAGEQPLIARNVDDINGFDLRNWTYMETDFNGTKNKGLIRKYYSSAEYGGTSGYFWSPVEFGDPATFSASDINVNSRGALEDNANDSSFKGKTTGQIDVKYHAGTYYTYITNINSPTDDTYYIVLKKSTDLLTFDNPASYLLKDYRAPYVFKYNDKHYMIAYHTLTDIWHLIPGSSYESFDSSKASSIDLANSMYGKGGWDDTPWFTAFQQKQPRISGVEVVNSKVYLFYLAGGFNQLTADGRSGGSYHGAPYDGPRGIGVMELSID